MAMEFLSSITPPYDIVPVHHAIYLGLAQTPRKERLVRFPSQRLEQVKKNLK